MTDTIATTRRRRLALGVVTAAAAAGVLTGCTVSGTAKPPNPQIVSQYVQKHNAQTQCSAISTRLSSKKYNEMIKAYNDSGSFGGLDKGVLAELDQTIAALRSGENADMPADLKNQFGQVAEAAQAQRNALAANNLTELNNTAQQWNSATRELRTLCLRY
ncbi:hypothetical protein [Gordonia sp. (in: high G+C Gram-positive bacteria)]|uniref:hypothetical protein n=1 Tax=Gordonia sp. (in: high G+C Gram-positive bacteria) TaxID=84139 RepID=UPI0039E4092D